jgi:hypothetical protein
MIAEDFPAMTLGVFSALGLAVRSDSVYRSKTSHRWRTKNGSLDDPLDLPEVVTAQRLSYKFSIRGKSPLC